MDGVVGSHDIYQRDEIGQDNAAVVSGNLILIHQMSIKGTKVDGQLKKADTIVVGYNLLEKSTSY